MNKTLIGALVAVVVVLGGGWTVWALSNRSAVPVSPLPTAVSTPVTPAASSTPPAEQVAATAAINQRILLGSGIHVTPLAVVEDSRCPMGVYCIQAGTVRVKVSLEAQGKIQTQILTLSQPFLFGGKNVTLVSAAPPKAQHTTLTPSDYRFTFSVTSATAGSGILSGTMSIGPICPVEQVGNPCKPTPEMYTARKVAVYASDKKTLITTLTPDANGAFSTALPAGNYYIDLAVAQTGVGSVRGVPATISIQNALVTSLSISIDTGIR